MARTLSPSTDLALRAIVANHVADLRMVSLPDLEARLRGLPLLCSAVEDADLRRALRREGFVIDPSVPRAARQYVWKARAGDAAWKIQHKAAL